MSGRELDVDGTDTHHVQHPWEQAGHPSYLPPGQRSRANWPPVPTFPMGPAEARSWLELPEERELPSDWWNKIYGVR